MDSLQICFIVALNASKCVVKVLNVEGFKIEPIMEFKNKKQAKKCLREWQEILFLNNWTIDLELVDDLSKYGEDVHAWCDYRYSMNAANIIIRKNCDRKNKIVKMCDEYYLVHELLHLIIDAEKEYNGEILQFEEYYHALSEHAKLDRLAKSLIMAKYNLTFEWFSVGKR